MPRNICVANIEKNLSCIKNIILVASGKGGVGKSTTSLNLALSLQVLGKSVGILDADIYGPSQRKMLGIPNELKPEVLENNEIVPIEHHGLKAMSAAFLSDEKAPMVWRGPMAVRALQQMLTLTKWGQLDFLIIDMPPGTGDIHISLAQQFNISAAIVVTTPQTISEIDARKAIEMLIKVKIPIMGIVENMASFTCPHCREESRIFGDGAASRLASDYQIPTLASLPLMQEIQENADNGVPSITQIEGSEASDAYLSLAAKVIARSYNKPDDTSKSVNISIV
jgi:ATP-binding protein involved in chromosome partitioning